MVADTTTILSLVFGVIILFLGLWVYKIKQYALALYLALAFGIFAVSYLEVLLGVSTSYFCNISQSTGIPGYNICPNSRSIGKIIKIRC